MAQASPALKYRVTEGIFDSKSMLDETNFYHQRQGAPSELTKKLTYIMGDYTRNYPISLATVGGIGYGGSALSKAAVEIDDVQFTYPVMGRMDKASIVSSNAYTPGDKPGIGNSSFKIRFTDNWLKRFYIIQSARGIQAYIHADGVLNGLGEYEYTVSLNAALPTDFCPLTELDAGNAWIDITTQVAESESRTTEGNMVMPGLFKNQMGFMRHGYSFAGNAAKKMMKINIKNGEGTETNVWMDYAMWQYELQWLSISEHNYWYSRYNRQANGEISLKDALTGKVIPTGSGILEQIQNKSTYSDLTFDYLVNNIGDALFAQSDTQGMMITLQTGRGGMRVFDRALKKAGISIIGNLGTGNVADKFITGSDNHLMLGGYFDGFYHIDGYTIKIKHNPIFDMGKVAMAQQTAGYTHPETGWPLESYRMVFIDDNDYDGQPNIQRVAQTGRAFLHGVVAGLTPLPKSLQAMTNSFNIDTKTVATMLSTDQDKTAYTRFSSCGIQILRANRCFDMQCIAGLS